MIMLKSEALKELKQSAFFVIFLGEEKLACDILEQLSHVERFGMVLLFMSATEKNGKGVFIVKCS